MISEFPLMLFTVLTGIAIGAYVGAALFPKKGSDEKAWIFPLVALILLACGGFAAMGHLGRPGLMMNVLNNPGSSITMEGICTGIMAVIAIVDLVLAKQKGLATGIVVTSHVCDATPSAFYGHVPNRGMSTQIINDMLAARLDIVVGGGRKYFTDPEKVPENMIDKAVREGFTYAATPEDFYATTKTPIIGLFADGSYPMAIERDTDFLMDATMHTLDILDDNKKGFFAMIEGSHIDHAEHANNAEQLTFEMEEFDKLLNAVFDYADTHKGTLVVVTADHETGGVTLLPGSKDFTKGDTGIDVKFSTTGHSGSPVPIYAYGASAWKFGQVMENIEIFSRIKALLIDK